MKQFELSRALKFSPIRAGMVSPSFLKGLLVLFLSILIVIAGIAAAGPLLISPGLSHTQNLRVDQLLSFEFEAEANKFYLLEIDQGGLDLEISIEDPSGSSTSFNSPLLRDEDEVVLIDTDGPGKYSLSAISHEYAGVVASVRIQLSELTPSIAAERELLAGLRLLTEASQANQQQNLDGWTDALQAYEKANVHFLNAGDSRNLARSLFSMATIEYWQMSRWNRSASLAASAADLYRDIDRENLAANAIQLQAAALVEKALEVEKSDSLGLAPEAQVIFDEALGLFRQALEMQERLGFEYDVARITNNIGYTYQQMGDLDNAAPYFHQAAAYYREAEQWQDELYPLNNLAVIDIDKSNLINAIKTCQRILEILPAGKQNRIRSDILMNLGAAQLTLDQLTDALKSYSAALSLQREIDDINGQGYSLAGIGTTYYSLGQQELALEYLETAYAAAQQANNGTSQVSVLKFIGKIESMAGNNQAALESHQRALRLVTSPMDKAYIELQISEDLVAGGRAGEAIEMLSPIRAMVKETRNPKLLADAMRVSGDAWLQMNQPAESLRAFQDAAAIYRALSLDAERSRSVFGAAKAARELGLMDQALEQAQLADSSVENLRSQLIAPQFRTFFLSMRQEYYAFLIDTLIALHQQSDGLSEHYLREALSVSERSRARALVDLISEASINLERSGDAGKNQQKLYRQMAENRYRLERLLDKPPEAGLENRITSIRQDLARIENELNLLQIEIRDQNPGYASLTAPAILDADQIQQMLDADSVLLQYSLGENRSFVFRVSRNSLEAHVLPGRDAIEQTARQLRNLLKAPAFTATARSELATAVSELSNQILEPVGELNQRQVLVVADGVLHYLPFSILHVPGRPDASDPLLANHEIVNLPSLTVLSAQRANQKNLHQRSREIAVFADPVFSNNDSRFGDLPQGNPLGGSNPNALSLNDEIQLARLPATAREAQSIIELVDPDRSLLALGFDSSLGTVMNSNLEDYRIIHFATHGRIDTRYPALSELVFSQFDERGNPQDGSLHLHDIYNLKLRADLVAMSACDTALGRQIAGEGMTGLTQGFMYAGSRSVLASLWQVPDRATAELMTRFYRNLLDKNQKPAAALRNAQLDLASMARWRSPYFWSGFVLQGEWL